MRERLDALAGYLFILTAASVVDWSRQDVADILGVAPDILGVAPDSLRRQRYGLCDRKTRWWPGTGDRRHRLPRVYREDEPEPDGHPAVAVKPPPAPALEYVEAAARSALVRATAGPGPRIIAVFGLSDGSVSTLIRGLTDRPGDEILAVVQTAKGQIAYDPLRVALALEWLAASPPRPRICERVGRPPTARSRPASNRPVDFTATKGKRAFR